MDFHMKRNVLFASLIAAFVALFLYFSFSQIVPAEIENAPDWMVLEEALEQVNEDPDRKLILIDIFEVGCRFCRQMEREVYPSESIRTLIDRSFYPVKVNGNSDSSMRFLGEEMSEQQFASRMGVTAFPFTVVMDGNGNVIASRRGYMGVSELSRFLNNALRDVQT